ncbi:conserved hypothetical protein [Uncinocarpus reesii 1704]|uniref:DUF4110 domain-containing protein n=1 Tax=Uncinocarpus reesii (strain UAMH 1704) TaxID=336963 RepID=C4JFJ4_UNCRE|nr:uncharacterized protein UREG_01008 [Uncinocarpus reesii 1704]EEP76159.1 conserved hypothetical protein [Uncinocarpus reesii 1704]
MAKDKKAKKAEQKARTVAKQAKKASQKEKKGKSKGNAQDDSDVEDVDLDAVLAAYAEEQAKFLKVTESSSGPPAPRSSSTLIASPSNRNELLLFGGEYYDGALATFFNNLYIYLIDRNEWREVTSPNSPLPRSGHAWCRGGNAGGIYLFGGEFSSPKQGTFYHYNDFWHLDPSTREWTRLETKGKGPPARSGHRMTYFKNYIILFGGFQDTSQQTKYLQDLWIYDCQKYTWYNSVLPPASQKPDARSSFSFLPHESGAVLYGGYSRVKMSVTAGKGQKGGSSQRMTLKPMVHQDTWFLRITPPAADAPASSQPTVRWERRKKPANPPNPPRAGVTMAYHKGRGILFGGVHDVEATEEGIDSEFFDTLYAWNIERNRFFQLSLRKPRAGNKKQQAGSQAVKSRNRSKEDEEELLRNLARLEAKGGLSHKDNMEMEIHAITTEDEDIDLKQSLPVKFEMPHPRFNGQLAVQEDTLFIYGGTFERKDQEFTFNDLYSIDLMKLNGVKEIFFEEPEHWNDAANVESDEEMEDEESESENEDEEMASVEAASTALTEITEPNAMELEAEQEPVEMQLQDSRPHPRPFESLREFFTRTSTEWQEILLTKLKDSNAATEKTIKELRKDAFDLAEEKWWDCREEITALEDEQEEAGIGEVVSMSERAEMPSAGRRR